jgi:ribosome-binding factor A
MKDFADRNRRRRRGRCASDDASELFFGSGRSGGGGGGSGRRDHKTAQLCRQVFWALSMALGDCADDVLRELVVVDVTPAPDAGRLLVAVGFSSAGDAVAVAEVMGRLEQARGFLRREVAGAITRKRAPELMFVLVAAGNGGEEGGR